MQTITLTTTLLSLLSLATSTPLTPRQTSSSIALGYRVVRDGAQFIAWEPSQTPASEVCDNHVVISTNHSGNIDRAICGTTFSIGEYQYVYLACATNPGTPATDDVVNVKDAHGFDILACVKDESVSQKCNTYVGVGQKFLCGPI